MSTVATRTDSSVAVDAISTTFAIERPTLKRARGRKRNSIVPQLLLPYFVAGEENRLAAYVATCDPSFLMVANPVLIVGPAQSGKTTLALHVANRVSVAQGVAGGHDGPVQVTAMSCSDFARGYADAVDVGDVDEFRESMVTAPILVLDDLSGLASKSSAQTALQQWIDARSKADRLTILTCRRIPSEIKGLSAPLVSRCMPGMTVRLEYPSGESRKVVINDLACALGLAGNQDLNESQASAGKSGAQGNHQQEVDPALLEILDVGLANDLSAVAISAAIKAADLHRRMKGETHLEVSSIQSAIDDADRQRKEKVTPDRIAKAVARHYGVKLSELKSPSRQRSIVRARSLAMWLIRRMTGQSTHRIGRYFGDRDHTTVMHAVRRIEEDLNTDIELQRSLGLVQERLSA